MTKERALVKAQQYRWWADIRKEKLEEMYKESRYLMENFDWTEPVKVGHHSERRHRKMFEKRNNLMQKIADTQAIIKRFLEKADNLERFANTHKGDAEKRHQANRDLFDQMFKTGDVISY